MSAAKRPASNSFGSSQLVVKRQKSSADINGKTVAVTNGSSSSGALLQAVSFFFPKQHAYGEYVLNEHPKKAG
jgi:ABC-type amino acid transport substrate-binding protein